MLDDKKMLQYCILFVESVLNILVSIA